MGDLAQQVVRQRLMLSVLVEALRDFIEPYATLDNVQLFERFEAPFAQKLVAARDALAQADALASGARPRPTPFPIPPTTLFTERNHHERSHHCRGQRRQAGGRSSDGPPDR